MSEKRLLEKAAVMVFVNGIRASCDALEALVCGSKRARTETADVAMGRSEKDLDKAVHGNAGCYAWVDASGKVLRKRKNVAFVVLAEAAGVRYAQADVQAYKQWGKDSSVVAMAGCKAFAWLTLDGKRLA